MGPHGSGAARECATKREVHARGNIFDGPVDLAILGDQGERILPFAGHIRRPRPDVPFVEVGVQIDAERPNHSRVKIDRRQIAIRDLIGLRANGNLTDCSASDRQRGRCKRIRRGIAAILGFNEANRNASLMRR